MEVPVAAAQVGAKESDHNTFVISSRVFVFASLYDRLPL